MREDSQTGQGDRAPGGVSGRSPSASAGAGVAAEPRASSETRVGSLGEDDRLAEPAIERDPSIPQAPTEDEEDLTTQLTPEPAASSAPAPIVSAPSEDLPVDAALPAAEEPARPMSATALGPLEGSDQLEELLQPSSPEAPAIALPSSETELEPLASPGLAGARDEAPPPSVEENAPSNSGLASLEDRETGQVPAPEISSLEAGETGELSAPELKSLGEGTGELPAPELEVEAGEIPAPPEIPSPEADASGPEQTEEVEAAEAGEAAGGTPPSDPSVAPLPEAEPTETADQPSAAAGFSALPRAASVPRLPTTTQPLLDDEEEDEGQGLETLAGDRGVPLKPGAEVVQGRYQVKSLWHQGLQVRIYRALGPAGNVAIYELCDPMGRPDLVRVVRQLADRPAALKHPHLISVLEVCEDPVRGPLAIVEAPQGGTLRQLLEHRGTPLSARTAAVVMRPLAEAVAHLHQHGVFIRAVTPDNVFFTPDGKPKLNAVLETLGAAFSTERVDTLYLAPEGRVGGAPDTHGDVWSLGACLQFSVLGPDRWRRSPAQIPPPLVPVIARAMDNRADQRFPSAAAFAAALGRIARPDQESLLQNPLVFGGGIAALVALMVLVVALLPSSRPEVSKAPVVAKFNAAPPSARERPRSPQPPAAAPSPPPAAAPSPQPSAASSPPLPAAVPALPSDSPQATPAAAAIPALPSDVPTPAAAPDAPVAQPEGIPTPALAPPPPGPSATVLKKATRFRRRGDRAARKRRWISAALSYRRALALTPRSKRLTRRLRKVERKAGFIKARNSLRRTLAHAKSLDDDGARAAFQSLRVLTPESPVVMYWQRQTEEQ